MNGFVGVPDSNPSNSAVLHLADLESAINHWRGIWLTENPSSNTLSSELKVLAGVYALMLFNHTTTISVVDVSPKAMQAWLAWYDTTADTPCIAICSTSQGDAICKGCGRTFFEVQHWLVMSAVEKRATWHRITQQHTAWRFHSYRERTLHL